MIAKHIKRQARGSFGRLAEYIAAASDKGEKLDQFWTVNCNAGDTIEDLNHCINEVEATQALNTRAKSNKTYHLIASFRDEKPSPEALIDIEKQLATALEFEDHQRVVATHQNTDNFHMHIAFNRINPKTKKLNHTPNDFKALESACRAIEAQHDLKTDKGHADVLERPSTPSKAQDMEAHTWEQSFASYVQALAPELEKHRKSAKKWKDLHDGFAEYGLRLQKKGNGLIVSDVNHKARNIKASSISRQFSKTALEKQLGAFVASSHQTKKSKQGYEAKPLTRHKGQSKLWKKYRAGRISGLMTAYRNWKLFLQAEAMSDPLAMAILIAQRQLIGGITGTGQKQGKPQPRTFVRPGARKRPLQAKKGHETDKQP
jgi:hypothetical protein